MLNCLAPIPSAHGAATKLSSESRGPDTSDAGYATGTSTGLVSLRPKRESLGLPSRAVVRQRDGRLNVHAEDNFIETGKVLSTAR
jgi:hypothetical protein